LNIGATEQPRGSDFATFSKIEKREGSRRRIIRFGLKGTCGGALERTRGKRSKKENKIELMTLYKEKWNVNSLLHVFICFFNFPFTYAATIAFAFLKKKKKKKKN
jgi:hypothetical protein